MGNATMRSTLHHPHHGQQQTGTIYNGKVRSSSFYPLLNSPVSSNSLATGATSSSDHESSGPSSSSATNGATSHGEHHWHLVKPTMLDDISKESSSSSSAASMLMHKAIPEIFLTRLLSTKGTIQKYVDDFFRTILVANDALPSMYFWLKSTLLRLILTLIE